MTVTVALFGPFRDATDEKFVELEVETPMAVHSVLDALIQTVPALEDDLESISEETPIVITVDETHIQQLEGLDTVVESGSVVRLTPPITGGNCQD